MRCLLLIPILLLAGCQLPQWRVFQEKVPAPLVKSESQIELERQSADIIARKIEEPPELKPVAAKLSQSLGAPKEQIKNDGEDRLLASWNKELVKTQERLDELNAKLANLDGKKIEGTGINLFGPAAFLGIGALVALAILFPPVITVAWWLVQRASGALTRTAKGVSDFIKENPDSGEKLKHKLQAAQDFSDKQLISKIRTKLKG